MNILCLVGDYLTFVIRKYNLETLKAMKTEKTYVI